MRRLVFFIAAFILWLLLSFTFDWPHILTGLAGAALAAGLFGHFSFPDKCIPQEGAKVIAVKQFKKRKVKVWYFSFPQQIVVKTVA